MQHEDKEKLRKNRVFLVEQLETSDTLLAHLSATSPPVLTENMREEVEVEKTRMKRASNLLDKLPRRGPTAFSVFIEGLILSDQDHVAAQLDRDLATRFRSMHPRRAGSGHSSRPLTESHVWTNNDIPSLTGNMINIAQQLRKVDPRDTRLHNHEIAYRMEAQPRGYCLVFHNENFNEGTLLSKREGSMYDYVNVDQLFQQLYFETVHIKDKTAKEVLAEAKVWSHRDFSPHDALVVVVLSHGGPAFFYGVDGKKVSVRLLEAMFDGENCPSLTGKPKIFIIQTCQGGDETSGNRGIHRTLLSQVQPTDTSHDMPESPGVGEESPLSQSHLAKDMGDLQLGSGDLQLGSGDLQLGSGDLQLGSGDSKAESSASPAAKTPSVTSLPVTLSTTPTVTSPGAASLPATSAPVTSAPVTSAPVTGHAHAADSKPTARSRPVSSEETDAAPIPDPARRHEKADFIVANATVSGYQSYRDTTEGTFFIRALVEVFCACAHDVDLAEMLRLVRSRVADMETDKGRLQLPEIRETLMKKLYFFPGYPAPSSGLFHKH